MKRHIYIVLLATPAVLLIIWAIGYIFPTHFYSPGDLCKGHEEIKSCRQCHIPFKGVASSLCSTSDCHQTFKLSQFHNKQLLDLHISNTKECFSCHTEHKGVAGKITTHFDHNIVELNILNNCVTCHKADYQNAHPDKYNSDCKSCHISTTAWKAISFDHNTVSGKQDCIECHLKPKDNLHATVTDDCISCHNTEKWRPAIFDHDKYFPLTEDHYVSCETCHPNDNYKQYTCLNCHEHNTSHIRREHEEHDIYDYGDCLRCHYVTINGNRYGSLKGEPFDDESSDDSSD